MRIGCHSDTLWHLDVWPRVPAITLERPLDGPTLSVTSQFGGLVYVVVPDAQTGRLVVTIDGAVAAPLYVLGETSREEWATARRAPGPWAELGTSKVVLTVPSERIRDLDDPQPLLTFWEIIRTGGGHHHPGRPGRYHLA